MNFGLHSAGGGRSDNRNAQRASHAATEMMEIENIIRSTERDVGLMEMKNINRYAPFAVGLKPSARQGKARLRGLYRT
jgi:hypothetical protein